MLRNLLETPPIRAARLKTKPIIFKNYSENRIEIKEMVFTAIESRNLFTWENISAATTKHKTEGQEGRKEGRK